MPLNNFNEEDMPSPPPTRRRRMEDAHGTHPVAVAPPTMAATEAEGVKSRLENLRIPAAAPICDKRSSESIKKFGCDHYKRKCEFYTPCCKKTYRCRFCHDHAESHVLQREDVQELVCSTCNERQEVRKECRKCGNVFGKYFCYECKLFDDEDKEQFHCEGCGICRIGGRENFFHCPTCNMCLPTHLKGNHRCIENLSRSNCPICQEDIHTSREPSQIPPCNHLIHKSCFDQLVKSGHFFCPTCAHSLVDMKDMWVLYDRQINETPLPVLYQNLYVNLYCRDCLQSSRSSFHILGIKCGHCNGYNTVRDRGPFYRLVLGEFREATFADPLPAEMEESSEDMHTTSSSSSSSPSQDGQSEVTTSRSAEERSEDFRVQLSSSISSGYQTRNGSSMDGEEEIEIPETEVEFEMESGEPETEAIHESSTQDWDVVRTTGSSRSSSRADNNNLAETLPNSERESRS